MKPFKFFQKEVKGNLNVMDGQTFHTASITQQQYNLNRDMMAEQERVRRLEMLNHIRESENQIRLFQTTTVTTVNPKWWMKIKMFYQKFKYNSVIETNGEALSIFVITTSITIGVGLIIAKILNVW